MGRRTLLAVSCAAVVALGCSPKATVTQATPMANLQSYQTVLIRVAAADQYMGPQQVGTLEYMAVDRLRKKCKFANVVAKSQAPGTEADLIMDLNIMRLFRGADPSQKGAIRINNQSQVTAYVNVVVSDGINDELLGSAQIRGQSATMNMAGTSAAGQAITVVADKLAEIMGASGCHLERVARAPEPEEPQNPPPPTGGDPGDPGDPDDPDQPTQTGPTQEEIDRAEAYNDEGKAQFRQANASGAAAKFKAAIQLVPDARYYFNLCLAREAEGKFGDATAACQQVDSAYGANDRLSDKASQRLDIIAKKQSGS